MTPLSVGFSCSLAKRQPPTSPSLCGKMPTIVPGNSCFFTSAPSSPEQKLDRPVQIQHWNIAPHDLIRHLRRSSPFIIVLLPHLPTDHDVKANQEARQI